MVERAEHACRHGGTKRGLAAAHLGAGDPLGGDARAALKVVAEAQTLDLVAADGENQRPVLAIIDVRRRRPPEGRRGIAAIGGASRAPTAARGRSPARARPPAPACRWRPGSRRSRSCRVPAPRPSARPPPDATRSTGRSDPRRRSRRRRVPAADRMEWRRRVSGGLRSVMSGDDPRRPPRAVAETGPDASFEKLRRPSSKTEPAVQSLRRCEPDQVRRISAPQAPRGVPAVSQPLAGDLPGTPQMWSPRPARSIPKPTWPRAATIVLPPHSETERKPCSQERIRVPGIAQGRRRIVHGFHARLGAVSTAGRRRSACERS